MGYIVNGNVGRIHAALFYKRDKQCFQKHRIGIAHLYFSGSIIIKYRRTIDVCLDCDFRPLYSRCTGYRYCYL